MGKYNNLKEIVQVSAIEIEIKQQEADKIPSYLTLNLNTIVATELQAGDLIIIDKKDLEQNKEQRHNNWQNSPWRHFFYDASGMDLLADYLPYLDKNKLICRIEGRSFYDGGEVMCLRGSIVLKNNL